MCLFIRSRIMYHTDTAHESIRFSLFSALPCTAGLAGNKGVCCICRSLLEMYEPSALITVGTNQAISNTGVNQASRGFHQVPLGRAYFDDTKVKYLQPVSFSCHCATQLTKHELITCLMLSSAAALLWLFFLNSPCWNAFLFCLSDCHPTWSP